jgi:hypothetical protein
MISIRIHTGNGERLLAACDEELLGMSFTEGVKRLNVSKVFYGGELITEAQLTERMKSVTIINLVGERAVDTAVAAGHVSAEMIITVDGVKHAQAVMM